MEQIQGIQDVHIHLPPSCNPIVSYFSLGATVNLSAPLIVPESERFIRATVSLIEPFGITTITLEIDVNDMGITATRNSMFNFTLSYFTLPTILFQLPVGDYRPLFQGQQTVAFQGVDRPGCCERTLLCRVTNDNIAEPDEILTLSIVRSVVSNQLPVNYIVQRVNVTIVDDDSECVNMYTCLSLRDYH